LEGVSARRIVFKKDFEEAHGYEHDPDHGKPYSAYQSASTWDLGGLDKPLVKYLGLILNDQPWGEKFSQLDLGITG
jgi:hypothetical protein